MSEELRSMTNGREGSLGNGIRLLMRVPVPWVFVLTYLIGVGLEFALPAHLPKHRFPGVRYAGVLLFVAGAAVAGWSLLIFHRARTTTVPGKRSSRLVTWGPYRFTRNPMYVGLITAYLGEAGILEQIWPVLLLPLVILYVNSIVIPVEESRLKEAFQQDYDRYRARVRRWM